VTQVVYCLCHGNWRERWAFWGYLGL